MKLVSSSNWTRKRGQAAITLMDTLLASVIIGITASGLLGAFAGGFLMTRYTRENQRATQILLEKVETLRLYSWDQINTPDFVPTSFTNTFDPQASAGDQGTVYYGTFSITNAPFTNSYSDSVRLVTVSLSWSTGSLARNRVLSTLVSRDGLQNYVY